MRTNVCLVKPNDGKTGTLTRKSEKNMQAKTKKFSIQRTVMSGTGISAYIELSAVDATDAEYQAHSLFAHEGSVATYTVRRLVA